MKDIKLSLVLPVHNQEDIIEPVLKNIIEILNKLKIQYEVLLIENGSKDNTHKVISKLSRKYSNVSSFKTSKGYGSAVLFGLRKAKGEFISHMPSDGQIDMSVFTKLWKNNIKNDFDIIKIRRSSRETKTRFYLSKTFSLILRVMFNTPLIDVNGSPRILSREKMLSLKLKSTDSFIDAEMLIKSKKLNWRIKEIPMKHIERAGGKSTRNYKTYLEFIRNILIYKINSR